MDNYEKVRVVGRGAFGVCWLCRGKNDASHQKVSQTIVIVSLDSFTFEAWYGLI